MFISVSLSKPKVNLGNYLCFKVMNTIVSENKSLAKSSCLAGFKIMT